MAVALNPRSELGDWIVTFGMATRAQVNACVRRREGSELIGQVFVRESVLPDQETCKVIAKLKDCYRRTAANLKARGIDILLTKETRIGDLLVALGFVDPAKKDYWVDRQAAERKAGNDPGNFGSLLIADEACTEEQVKLAMRLQDWLRGVK